MAAAGACFLGLPLKWVSLFLMVMQTVSMVLLLRVSRTQTVEGPRFLNTTAIFLSEVLKFFTSLALHWFTSPDASQFLGDLSSKTGAAQPLELARTCVPSLLYAVQNNLLYVGISHLSAGTYQVTCQFKILTTAFLSMLILGTKLSGEKWAALVMLTVGVALVDTGGKVHNRIAAGATDSASTMLGLASVAGGCFLSGLAGVYLEKMLKQTGSSIWVRNIQLAMWGSAFALFIALRADGAAIRQNGFLQGYNRLVWAVVLCQALGGLLVAAVMKYADSILKCFGCAVAIVLTCTFSALELHELVLDWRFLIGMATVLSATALYNLGLPERRSALAPLAEGRLEAGSFEETRPLIALKGREREPPSDLTS